MSCSLVSCEIDNSFGVSLDPTFRTRTRLSYSTAVSPVGDVGISNVRVSWLDSEEGSEKIDVGEAACALDVGARQGLMFDKEAALGEAIGVGEPAWGFA